MKQRPYVEYPYNPPHLFLPNAIYFITGATFKKLPLIDTDEKKNHFCQVLFGRTELMGWKLEAWSILPNHYHLVARSPSNAVNLPMLIKGLHSISAKFVNRSDQTPGRRVWHNYWDTCLTHETSYLVRLKYVHTNPVKHGVVNYPEEYPYCSYRWFVSHAKPNFIQTVLTQPIDRIGVRDDF